MQSLYKVYKKNLETFLLSKSFDFFKILNNCFSSLILKSIKSSLIFLPTTEKKNSLQSHFIITHLKNSNLFLW